MERDFNALRKSCRESLSLKAWLKNLKDGTPFSKSMASRKRKSVVFFFFFFFLVFLSPRNWSLQRLHELDQHKAMLNVRRRAYLRM